MSASSTTARRSRTPSHPAPRGAGRSTLPSPRSTRAPSSRRSSGGAHYSLLLGLERLLSEEEPHLVDGTVLSAHQVDALSGTLTALLAEAQRNGNGSRTAATAPPAPRSSRCSSRPRRSPARRATTSRTMDEDEDEDEEPQDWQDERRG